MVSLVAQLFIETARAVAGSAFARRESNPLDRGERFQHVLTIIPPSCSPDASAMRYAYCALRSYHLGVYKIAHSARQFGRKLDCHARHSSQWECRLIKELGPCLDFIFLLALPRWRRA
jgi:hypothetical protein